jgi:hypothetical protein
LLASCDCVPKNSFTIMKANSFVRTVLLLPSPHEAIFVQNRGAVFHESRMFCRKSSLVFHA